MQDGRKIPIRLNMTAEKGKMQKPIRQLTQ